MDLTLSDEQVALRDTVRRFLTSPHGALEDLAPGAELGMVDAVVVAEELGRARYEGPWIATEVGGRGAGVVATHGLDRVLGAPQAEVVLVPEDGKLVAYRDFTVEPVESVDPTVAWGSVDVSDATAEGVHEVDVDAVRDAVVIALAADALGAADAVREVATEYAKVRHQFGQPIGSFQAVQHLCVDMYETVELFRGGVLHAAWAADVGDAELRSRAATRLLAFGDRLATVGDTAIQVLGGIGFTWEHDAHRWLRRLLGFSTAFGPASSHRVALGRML